LICLRLRQHNNSGDQYFRMDIGEATNCLCQ
jgi:hypothetical protein